MTVRMNIQDYLVLHPSYCSLPLPLALLVMVETSVCPCCQGDQAVVHAKIHLIGTSAHLYSQLY